MKKRLPPMFTIIIGFACLCVFGTIILFLPFSQKNEGLSLVDSFFVSVSAVCITGMSPVENLASSLSVFGKVFLTILIQIGGLGFVTVAMFILSMIGAKIGISERYLVKDALNQNSSKGMIKLVRDIS